MFGSYFLAKMTKSKYKQEIWSAMATGRLLNGQSSDYFWWLQRNRPVTMKPEGPSTCKYLAVQRLHCNSLRQKKIPFYPLATQKWKQMDAIYLLAGWIFGKIVKKKFHSFGGRGASELKTFQIRVDGFNGNWVNSKLSVDFLNIYTVHAVSRCCDNVNIRPYHERTSQCKS